MTDVRREGAWGVIEASAGDDGCLRAAAGSALYPHVWTRDVGMSAFGILACARSERDVELVLRSLEAIAKHQTALGRMPLKVDVKADVPVLENSAGVDSSLWFAVAVDAAARSHDSSRVRALVPAAVRGVEWAMHLDANGDSLLETPEASDWADMMPHRHAVLFTNVLYAEALDAASRLLAASASEGDRARPFAEEAVRVRSAVRTVFSVRDLTNAAAVGDHLNNVSAANPEFGLTAQYATRYGDLPFLLPYVAFRAVGTHCDIVGNLLAVLTGVLDGDAAHRLLDYLAQVGAASPAPTKTIYPPIQPGHPDWRDHFLWRNLNVPHHYQNGGSWPFAGAMHVAALVRVGRMSEAKELLSSLEHHLARGPKPFPEWQHGVTGASMGEPDQLWSAAGWLF
ncbi:MAG: hypothetical protein KC417_16105, partial [Myxococcales bacterium]|nr:hypothetical protein [Myxococcales bacterium]